MNDNAVGTSGGGDQGAHAASGSQLSSTIVTVVVATIVGAILTFVGNFLSEGGVIRVLGGLSVSQFSSPQSFPLTTNCGNKVLARLTDVKKSFCFLTDISIREGNSIGERNKDGWTVCKIEEGKEEFAGIFVLTSQMDGHCDTSHGGTPEITCKARCISF